MSRLEEWASDHSWLVPAIAGLVGAVAFAIALGPPLVNPTNIDWLMHGDFALHFLGWHLYRHGPWTMPIGETPLLIWPIGSSIGLTDSIPIAAFVFKLLDPLLPDTFQFIGPWLVSCFALQGVFGVLLMRIVSRDPILQLLGAALLTLSPLLIFRIGHAALSAHWLLLASLWLALRHDAEVPSGRLGAWWAALVGFAAATQPYLWFMVVLMMFGAHGRQLIVKPSQVLRIASHVAISLAVGFFALWQSGSLGVGANDGLEVGGFGGWSTNLLSLIAPTEWSTLWAPGPFRYAWHEQYEGYAYLGAGTLLLLLIALVLRLASIGSIRWSHRVWQFVPLGIALLFLYVMALGPIVTVDTNRVYGYDVSLWGPLTVFRTNGRMIWPLYYTIVIGVLFAIARLVPRRAVALCLVGMIVQAADIAGMVEHVRDIGTFGFRDPLRNEFWNVVTPHYRRLVLVPTNLCTHDRFVEPAPFALLAGRMGIPINAGTTARYDWRRTVAYCQDLEREMRQGLQSPDSLYIIRTDMLPKLVRESGGSPLCTVVDKFGVCFSTESYLLWRDSYDVVRSQAPPVDEFVRFYTELDRLYRDVLGRAPRPTGSPLDVRMEGFARYLSFRIEGCGHAESERRALGYVEGRGDRAFCPANAADRQLPGPDQGLAFMRMLDEALSKRTRSGHVTPVDLEGEAVWLLAYARERATGITTREAGAAVLASVRAAAGL
jgi:hypothetical protein